MLDLRFLLVVLCVLGALIGTAGAGELFKWIDDQGNVHYGDRPPENARLGKITGKVSSFSSVSVEKFEFDPKLIYRPRASRSVVMYMTSWCNYCRQAARYFRRNKISFTEYDIEKSAKGAQDYRRLGGRGVPIILIGDRRMNGFNEQTFDQIYYDKS